MCCLHADFIFQVAVESGQLESGGLSWHGTYYAMVCVHRRIEVHLLVVDINLKSVVKILSYDGYCLSRARFGESAVRLSWIGHSDCRDFGNSAGRVVITTGSDEHLQCSYQEQDNQAGFEIYN